jgi:hypothetical protein
MGFPLIALAVAMISLGSFSPIANRIVSFLITIYVTAITGCRITYRSLTLPDSHGWHNSTNCTDYRPSQVQWNRWIGVGDGPYLDFLLVSPSLFIYQSNFPSSRLSFASGHSRFERRSATSDRFGRFHFPRSM